MVILFQCDAYIPYISSGELCSVFVYSEPVHINECISVVRQYGFGLVLKTCSGNVFWEVDKSSLAQSFLFPLAPCELQCFLIVRLSNKTRDIIDILEIHLIFFHKLVYTCSCKKTDKIF